jgi:hypothetical protein
MAAIQIPKGIGIHGMHVLLNINTTPSVLDLKRYDAHGVHNEINILKRRAFSKPVNDNALKCLSLDEIPTWSAKSERLSLVWKHMSIEHQTTANDKLMVFTLDVAVAREQGIFIGPKAVRELMRLQQTNLEFGRPTCTDPNNQMILGWIKYQGTDTNILIHEMQSQLEVPWPIQDKPDYRNFEISTLIEILLADAMRVWLNAGVTTIDLKNARVKRDEGCTFPKAIYTALPRRNSFNEIVAEGVWRFTVR